LDKSNIQQVAAPSFSARKSQHQSPALFVLRGARFVGDRRLPFATTVSVGRVIGNVFRMCAASIAQ
jgi:hypothetical protein